MQLYVVNRAGEPEPCVFGAFEPEPLQKKQELKLEPPLLYRLLEDKKHKEIVHL